MKDITLNHWQKELVIVKYFLYCEFFNKMQCLHMKFGCLLGTLSTMLLEKSSQLLLIKIDKRLSLFRHSPKGHHYAGSKKQWIPDCWWCEPQRWKQAFSILPSAIQYCCLCGHWLFGWLFCWFRTYKNTADSHVKP